MPRPPRSTDGRATERIEGRLTAKEVERFGEAALAAGFIYAGRPAIFAWLRSLGAQALVPPKVSIQVDPIGVDEPVLPPPPPGYSDWSAVGKAAEVEAARAPRPRAVYKPPLKP